MNDKNHNNNDSNDNDNNNNNETARTSGTERRSARRRQNCFHSVQTEIIQRNKTTIKYIIKLQKCNKLTKRRRNASTPCTSRTSWVAARGRRRPARPNLC